MAWSFFFFLIKHQKLSEKGEKNKTLHLMRWNHTDKTSAQTDPCNFFLFFFFLAGPSWSLLWVSWWLTWMFVANKDWATRVTTAQILLVYILVNTSCCSSQAAQPKALRQQLKFHNTHSPADAADQWDAELFFFSQCSTDLGVAACISEKIKSMKQTKEQSLAPWLKQHFFSTFSIWQTFHESYF